MSTFPSLLTLLITIFPQLVHPFHHHRISLHQPEQQLHQLQQPALPSPLQRSKRQTFDFSMNTPPPDSAPESSESTPSTTTDVTNGGDGDSGPDAGDGDYAGDLAFGDLGALLGLGAGGDGDGGVNNFPSAADSNSENTNNNTDNSITNSPSDLLGTTNGGGGDSDTEGSFGGGGGSFGGGGGGSDDGLDVVCSSMFQCLFHECFNGGTCVVAATPPNHNSTSTGATAATTATSSAPSSSSGSSCNPPTCECPPPYDDAGLYDEQCGPRFNSPPASSSPSPVSLPPARKRDCMGDGSWICYHGECIDTSGDDQRGWTKFHCRCDRGWVGDYCEVPCTRNCSNNGTCKVLDMPVANDGNSSGGDEKTVSEEVCVCPYPWEGLYCTELPPEEGTDNSLLYWLGGSLGVGILLLPVLAGLFLYYLWKKRMVFAMKFVFYFKPYEDNDGLQYDAFVSYVESPEDMDFAHKVLPSILENSMGFRLCLQHRDFILGGAKSDTIVETLEESRRFILVLTPRYLKCEWAQFEYLRAFHEMLKLKIRIVPIILEDFSLSQADNPTLRTILESTYHIKYPGDQASQREIDKFWKRVRLSMPKMKKQKEKSCGTISTEMTLFEDPTSKRIPPDDVENGTVAAPTSQVSAACRYDDVGRDVPADTARPHCTHDVDEEKGDEKTNCRNGQVSTGERKEQDQVLGISLDSEASAANFQVPSVPPEDSNNVNNSSGDVVISNNSSCFTSESTSPYSAADRHEVSPPSPTQPSDVVLIVSATQPASPPSSTPAKAGVKTAGSCIKSLTKSRNIFNQLLKSKAEERAKPVTVVGIRPLRDG